jgi:hypothetical protein
MKNSSNSKFVYGDQEYKADVEPIRKEASKEGG